MIISVIFHEVFYHFTHQSWIKLSSWRMSCTEGQCYPPHSEQWPSWSFVEHTDRGVRDAFGGVSDHRFFFVLKEYVREHSMNQDTIFGIGSCKSRKGEIKGNVCRNVSLFYRFLHKNWVIFVVLFVFRFYEEIIL